jgi:hypothetical protein
MLLICVLALLNFCLSYAQYLVSVFLRIYTIIVGIYLFFQYCLIESISRQVAAYFRNVQTHALKFQNHHRLKDDQIATKLLAFPSSFFLPV